MAEQRGDLHAWIAEFAQVHRQNCGGALMDHSSGVAGGTAAQTWQSNTEAKIAEDGQVRTEVILQRYGGFQYWMSMGTPGSSCSALAEGVLVYLVQDLFML